MASKTCGKNFQVNFFWQAESQAQRLFACLLHLSAFQKLLQIPQASTMGFHLGGLEVIALAMVVYALSD